METLSNQADKLFGDFSENPKYAYLLCSILFFIVFLGILSGKKWATTPIGGGHDQIWFYKVFGKKAFEYTLGAVCLIASIILFLLFIYG